MSAPDSPHTPVGESLDSQESYMTRSMSTTQVTKNRRADRSKKQGKAKLGSRLGRLDETMMKRTHSVSPVFLQTVLFRAFADTCNCGITSQPNIGSTVDRCVTVTADPPFFGAWKLTPPMRVI